MEAFLAAWLPRFLPEGCTFQIHPYRGKNALLRKLGSRLEAYSKWMPTEYKIVVIVDRDQDKCQALKAILEKSCESAGLRSRRAAGSPDWRVVTRVAIEELEAWYFGDRQAVCKAYPRVSPRVPNQARYRNPDAITGGTWEAFERILQRYGYFRQGLAKLQAATAIGRHIDPAHNRSHSFMVSRDAIAEVVA